MSTQLLLNPQACVTDVSSDLLYNKTTFLKISFILMRWMRVCGSPATNGLTGRTHGTHRHT